MANLPKNIEYSDLNGSECAEILTARFWQFLEQIPEFQKRFALTRVKLRLEIVMDVWGASPPRKIMHDQLEISTTESLPTTFEPKATHHEIISEVDAFDNPPDLVREEHGLPVHRGQRGQSGFMETVPVILEGSETKFRPAPKPADLPPPPANAPSPNMKVIGKRTYASWVEQDKGAAVTGERVEQLAVGGDKLASISGGRGDVVMPQPDFLGGRAEIQGRAPDVGHIRQSIERSGELLTQADQQFQRAPDAAQLWSNGEGGGKK